MRKGGGSEEKGGNDERVGVGEVEDEGEGSEGVVVVEQQKKNAAGKAMRRMISRNGRGAQ
jgi:hypothetical protein